MDFLPLRNYNLKTFLKNWTTVYPVFPFRNNYILSLDHWSFFFFQRTVNPLDLTLPLKPPTAHNTNTPFLLGHTVVCSVDYEIFAPFPVGRSCYATGFQSLHVHVSACMCFGPYVCVYVCMLCVWTCRWTRRGASTPMGGWVGGCGLLALQIHPLLFAWHALRRLLETASIWCYWCLSQMCFWPLW